MNDKITAGVNPHLVLSHFTEEEKIVIDVISKEWYVTHGGNEIRLGATSTYKYILIKPIDLFTQMFNLEREIIVIFSPYEEFEPRTLDAISFVSDKYQNLRVERICSVLVSKDNNIEFKLKELLKNDQESQVIVPFSYTELLDKQDDPFFFRNRFKTHFYTRDLFALESPLKTDLYFFGRNDLVHQLVDRHSSNQVSGLFGLRKTGKTSVIFGVQRALERINQKSVFIDCQNPAFHKNRWYMALHFVLKEIKRQHNLSISLKPENLYTEEKSSIYFEELIIKMHNMLSNKNILLIFDEIENITFGISPTQHWSKDLDFVYFWQTLRSLFQKLPNVFSYLLVGTNPLCIEMEKILEKDNPIFCQIPISYIPRFDVPQTREMVRKLGKIMGLQFDEIIYGMLTEDFGGHPYLIRHVCSVINSISNSQRPVNVDKATYEKAKQKFIKDYNNFFDMILNVLKDYFIDEYEMLTHLAIGDLETFEEFAQLSQLYTNHLLGYGIIEEKNGNYNFRIESIKNYLNNKNKYKKLKLTKEEMLSEISERRNKLEPKLQKICRNQLLTFKGLKDANNCVLDIFGDPRKSGNAGKQYAELFDPNLSGILFSDLIKIIGKYWDCFKNIFSINNEDFLFHLNTINKYRVDAHSKNISKDEMQLFRLSMSKIEEQVDRFLN